MKKVFEGICSALITPMKDKEIDYIGLEKLINYQISKNISAILLLGTTGESPTLSLKEKIDIVRFARNLIPKNIAMIVGTGSNDTQNTIKQTRIMTFLGADACLIITPYYNKSTQKGLVEHYKQITLNTKIDIIVYNVPSRTGVNIEPKTMSEIASLPRICGLKEANGDIKHIQEMFKINPDLNIYSGSDELNYIFYVLGGIGAISVASNAFPNKVINVYDSFKIKDYEQARIGQNNLYNFNKLLFIEPNPIPIKFVLEKPGICQNELRMPLTKLESNRNEIEQEIGRLKNEDSTCGQ